MMKALGVLVFAPLALALGFMLLGMVTDWVGGTTGGQMAQECERRGMNFDGVCIRKLTSEGWKPR
jgi:hypothetical protein